MVMIVKDNSLVVSIASLDDIKKITDNTKYINLDISTVGDALVAYFIKYGMSYMYAEVIDGISGYTYVSYDEFVKAEGIISEIYQTMPKRLNDLEKARYLYIKLAGYLSFDINTDVSKCETYNLSLITNINNLWGSLALGRVSNISASKIYYYLCRRFGLSATLVIDSYNNSSYVKLEIKNQVLITDIALDIPYIAANMQTRNFGTYNDDKEIDKKIGYISDEYNDYYLDKALKDIDYSSDDFMAAILERTQKILDAKKIKPMELNLIYRYIFHKYAADYDIKISNLFLNTDGKFHFIVISYNDMHYSYNYREDSFVKVNDDDIISNLNMGKIGLYLDEFIPNINYTKHLLS